MKLKTEDFPFVLLTPAMIGGAEGKAANAEMRIASIRGQVRWWHRKAGLTPGCNDVWGQTDGAVIGSRVGLSVLPALAPRHAEAAILPHDLGKSGRPRDAIAEGQPFTIRLTRLVDCSPSEWETAQKAVKLWLLLGGLGLRVNRAAGSVWPNGAWVPQDAAALQSLLTGLGIGNHSVALIGQGKGKDDAILRATASDTVSDRTVFGGINDRVPSPTRFKVIRLSTALCLLAVAERKLVAIGAGKTMSLLQKAEHLLTNKPQPARWAALGPWHYLIP